MSSFIGVVGVAVQGEGGGGDKVWKMAYAS